MRLRSSAPSTRRRLTLMLARRCNNVLQCVSGALTSHLAELIPSVLQHSGSRRRLVFESLAMSPSFASQKRSLCTLRPSGQPCNTTIITCPGFHAPRRREFVAQTPRDGRERASSLLACA